MSHCQTFVVDSSIVFEALVHIRSACFIVAHKMTKLGIRQRSYVYIRQEGRVALTAGDDFHLLAEIVTIFLIVGEIGVHHHHNETIVRYLEHTARVNIDAFVVGLG